MGHLKRKSGSTKMDFEIGERHPEMEASAFTPDAASWFRSDCFSPWG
jgi:hypothetical protein